MHRHSTAASVRALGSGGESRALLKSGRSRSEAEDVPRTNVHHWHQSRFSIVRGNSELLTKAEDLIFCLSTALILGLCVPFCTTIYAVEEPAASTTKAKVAEERPAATEAAVDCICLECKDSACHFKPARLQRRPVGPLDVLVDIKFCGVCHTDLDYAMNGMAGLSLAAKYPCTPGHEIAGVCVEVGAEVTKVKVGDHVGVGGFVDSCGACRHCQTGEELNCKTHVGTYGGMDKGTGRAETYPKGSHTRGGYSTRLVVTERFVVTIPPSLPLEYAGPLMCSGITLYSPLKAHGAKTGTRVAVVGLGGLGSMGVRLAKALGCTVTAISRSNAKEEYAKTLGAEAFIASNDEKAMAEAAQSFDLVINTVPGEHDWGAYQALVDRSKGGSQVMHGLSPGGTAALILQKKNVKYGVQGSMKNLQEVVDLCAKEKIFPNIEVVPVEKITEVFEALDKANDKGTRYVLDIQGTLCDKTLDSWQVEAPKLESSTGMSLWKVARQAVRMLFH